MVKKRLVVTRWCLLLAMALVLCLAVGVGPAAGAGGARYVDKNVTRNCQGKTPCYPNIQAAVSAAQPGDTIYVFPATYNAGVDLSQMDPEGNISLITVDANGNPKPGTVTVDNPGDAPEIYTGDPPFHGDVTIDGFVLRSEYGAIDLWVGDTPVAPAEAEGGLGPELTRDVEIRNVDASETGEDGIVVRAEGDVTITDCTTNGNNGSGILVYQTWGDVTITGCTSNDNTCLSASGGSNCQPYGIIVGLGGKATISDCTTNGNGWDGISVWSAFSGSQEAGVASATTPDRVNISRCTANGNEGVGIESYGFLGDVTITDCTTNENGEDGVWVGRELDAELGLGVEIGGDVTIKNCTASGNTDGGFDLVNVPGQLTIQNCIVRDNAYGMNVGETSMAGGVLVNGNIICGHQCGVWVWEDTGIPNLVGNWWGCAEGPDDPGCDEVCRVGIVGADFAPWISKITASATVDPVVVGEPTVLKFQFHGGPPPVYLGKGPGDLRGPAPFTVSTDNGRLDGNGSTLHKFLGADGTLKVTLVPEHEGTATVTVSGPCGLTDLEGSKAVVDVLAEDFVPEPATMLLLGSGLMGLAGYASLRLRRR